MLQEIGLRVVRRVAGRDSLQVRFAETNPIGFEDLDKLAELEAILADYAVPESLKGRFLETECAGAATDPLRFQCEEPARRRRQV